MTNNVTNVTNNVTKNVTKDVTKNVTKNVTNDIVMTNIMKASSTKTRDVKHWTFSLRLDVSIPSPLKNATTEEILHHSKSKMQLSIIFRNLHVRPAFFRLLIFSFHF